jgi:(3,5-dihydroxyphenyl)acetyl-CoA 1,2-dioxygenase
VILHSGGQYSVCVEQPGPERGDMPALAQQQRQDLAAVGISREEIKTLEKALQALHVPARPTRRELKSDSAKLREICAAGSKILGRLPPHAQRGAEQSKGAETLKGFLREARNDFARAYVEIIFLELTDGLRKFVRAEELVYGAAEKYPGLCPARTEVEADAKFRLAEKDGVEVAQTDFLAHVFGNRKTGLYLVQAMLRPLPESKELAEKFRRDGRLDLGTVQVERRPPIGTIWFNNIRFLNAEDGGTLVPLETAADVILLDPEIEAGLLRGRPMEHTKYKGRRVFSSGLNLTHLYLGKISLMFYLTRDLGYVNKLYRGLAGDRFNPDAPEDTREKPWIAAVESFAIGGGCQVLLVTDYVVAEEGSYFNLPARKEGIIPGVAPLRFARFVGARAAQHGVLFDKSFPVDSPEARTIVNDVVPPQAMDDAIRRAGANATGAGLVSAGANRKALRAGQESLDDFRRYMALYCREQANCHFSPTLIANLERNWDAKNRRTD